MNLKDSISKLALGIAIITSTSAIAQTKTGYFIDAPVTGIYYTTDSGMNGTTEKGRFEYSDGDNVTFYLGSNDDAMVLATISGQELITPIHSAVTPSRTINMTRLLLSFDATPQDRSEIQLLSELLSDAKVQEQLKQVNLEELDSYVRNIPVELVSAQDAAKHLVESQDYIQQNFTSQEVVYSPLNKPLIEDVVTRRGWAGNLCFYDLARKQDKDYHGPVGRLHYKITDTGIFVYPSAGDYFGTDEANQLEASCNLNTEEAMTETEFEKVDSFEEWGAVFACSRQGCTRNDINGFDIDDFDDEGSWKYRSVAISFDAETGLIMEKSQGLGRSENVGHSNKREYLKFTSDNPRIDAIDISGFWRLTDYSNLDASGSQCLLIINGQVKAAQSNQRCSEDPSDYQQDVSNQFLDMWWLSSGHDTASLAQLNTPVKWYQQGEARYTSWEYLPAGELWDQGLLHRFSQKITIDQHGMQQVETLKLYELKKVAQLDN